jgi:hypothetical protein
MKKVLSLILVAVLCLSLVACGGKKQESSGPNAAVVEFVNENKSELLESMEESFATSSGMTCTSDIEVVGSGIVISIKINELEDLPKETKDMMQDVYDAMNPVFKQALDELKKEVPEVTALKIRVCEKDGDEVAVIKAGK